MSDAPPPLDSASPVIAFFDVDNTLLRGASVYHLGRAAFRRRHVRVRDMLNFAWQQAVFLAVGETRSHFARAPERVRELISGHRESEFIDLANEVYDRAIERRLWPETIALANEHVRKGHEVWLVTATPHLVANVIANRLGFAGALGTRLVAVDGVLTGELAGPIMHGAAKAKAAHDVVTRKKANLADCWAYSDSRHDIPLLTLVGNRIVVNPDRTLAAHAKEMGWAVMKLKRSSIRAAQRRVRRDARAVRRLPGATGQTND